MVRPALSTQITPAAERGASRSAFHLGRMHEEGWGVPVDYTKARFLYHQAADCDEWIAYVHLARMYRYGRGTSVDQQAALSWYQAAASASETISPCPELHEAFAFVRLHGPVA